MNQTKSIFLLFICVIITSVCYAQKNKIEKQKFHWGTEQDTTIGYTQALKVDNVLYISGTVARDVTAQGIQRVYANLERTLQHYGADFSNVVKETLYTTDMEAMKKNNSVRKAFYKGDFPSATWVQVSGLYLAEAKLEVELVAHLPRN